jgi:hypothetical protein
LTVFGDLQLRFEEVLQAHLRDLVGLGFEQVDVRFLVLQNRIQQFLGAVIALFRREPDGFVIGFDRAGLAVVVVLDLLGDIRADGDFGQIADLPGRGSGR